MFQRLLTLLSVVIFIARCAEDFTSLYNYNYTDLATDPTKIINFQNSTVPLQFTQYRLNQFSNAYQKLSISMWVKVASASYYQGRKIPLYLISSTLNGNIDFTDSKNVRLLLSAQNITNGIEIVFETYLQSSKTPCFSGSSNPIIDNSEWFFIYHGVSLDIEKSFCYIYLPSSSKSYSDNISTGIIPTKPIGDSFTIFLGGVLRPGFANWFGSISQPRVYLNTYYEDINVINKLHMLGTFTQIYREYLSNEGQVGSSLLAPLEYNLTNYKSSSKINSFLLDGYTYIQFSFQANADLPMIQTLMQIIPTNQKNNNRIILDILNTNLRLLFNGSQYILANLNTVETLVRDKSYNLRLFLYKPIGETILMVKYYLTTLRDNIPDAQYNDFQWTSLSTKIDTSNTYYYLYFGKAKIDIKIYNIFVTKGGLFTKVQNDCNYTLMDINTQVSNFPTKICTQCTSDVYYVKQVSTQSNFCTADCGTDFMTEKKESLFCQDLFLNTLPCTDTINCIQCSGTPDNCRQCKDGYYIDTKLCKKCPDNCTLCSSAAVCTKCSDNFALKNNQCVSCVTFDADCAQCQTTGCTKCTTKAISQNQLCVDTCDSGYYLQNDPIKKCIACNINCLSCALNDQKKENCLICKDKIVDNGIQYQIFQDQQETLLQCVRSCRTGQFSNLSTQKCELCQSGLCITCQDSKGNCKQCDPAYAQLDTVDSTNAQITLCSDDCVSYKSLEADGTIVNKLIKACPVGCSSCTSDQYSGCPTGSADNLHTFMHEGETDPIISDKCKDGFYFKVKPASNVAYTTCLKCDSNCLACQSLTTTYTSPDGKKCTSCNNGTYLDSSTFICVVTCATGYFQNQTTNTCDKCYVDCQECVGPTLNDCKQGCKNDAIQQITNIDNPTIFSCVLNCSVGYFQDKLAVTKQCTKCPIQCKTCLTKDGCSSCADAYYRGPVVANQNYINCLSDCSTAKQPDKFDSKHMIGYFNNSIGNICSECHPFCSSCQSASLLECTECTSYQNIQFYLQKTSLTATVGYCTQTCLDGYIKSTGGVNQPYICQTCSDECLTCDKVINNCTSCKSGKYLKKIDETSQTCVDQDSCGDGKYGDRTTLKCQSCDSSCKTCLGSATNCTSCLNKKLKNNRCIDANQYCGDGFFDYTDSNSLLSCQQCDQTCFKCSGSKTACTACKLGLFAKANKCISQEDCIALYNIPDNSTGVCLSCSEGCAKCQTSQSNCTSCLSDQGYYYQEPYKCSKDCDLGYYKTTDDKNVKVCKQCYLSCSKCLDGNENTCTACKAGYYLTSDKKCVATKGCPDGYYGDDLTNTCQQCHTRCATCFNPNNNQCNSCKKGFYLFNHSCQNCSEGCIDCDSLVNCKVCDSQNNYFLFQSKCYKQCPSGYFSDINQSLSCLQCDKKCKTCTGSSTQCIDCNQGYFKDGSDCKECGLNCIQCTSSSDCQKCTKGTFQLNNSALCSDKCPVGQYGNQISLQCESCHSSCKTCDGPYEFSCLTCSDASKVVKDGICLDPKECIGAYYLGQNNVCYPCDEGCLSCSDSSSNCSLCDVNYYFTEFYQNGQINKRCFRVCPLGYYPFSSKSDSESNILYYCQKCTKNCTNCAAPLFLYQDQCLETCPAGYTGSSANNTCQKSNNVFCQINNPQPSQTLDPSKVISFEGYLATTKPISGMSWKLVDSSSNGEIINLSYSGIESNTYYLQKALIIAPNLLKRGTQYQLYLKGTVQSSSDVCDKQLSFKTSQAITQGTLSVQKLSQQNKLDAAVQTYQFTISGFSTTDTSATLLFDLVLMNTQSNIPFLIAQKLEGTQPIQYTYSLQNQASIQQYIPQVIAYTDNSKVQVRSQTSISTQDPITKAKALSQIDAILTSLKFTFSTLDEINYLTNLFYQSFFNEFQTNQKNLISFQSLFDVFDSLNGNYQSTCHQSFFCNNKGTCGESKQYQRECECTIDYSGKNCQYLTTEFKSIQILIKAVIGSTLMSAPSSVLQTSLLKLNIIHNLSIGKDILTYDDLRYLINLFIEIIEEGNLQIKVTANSFSTIQDTIQNLLRSMCTSSTLTIYDKNNIDKLVTMYQDNIFMLASELAGQKNLLVDDIFVKYEIIYLNSGNIPSNPSINDVYTIQSQVSSQSFQIPLVLLMKNQTVMYFVAIQWKYNIFNQYSSYSQFSTSQFTSMTIIDGKGSVVDVSSFENGLIISLPKNYNYSPLQGNLGQKKYRCTYLEEFTNKWQETGCTFVSETLSSILCKCTHFTTFSAQAIPYNLQKKPSIKDILLDNGWNSLQEFLNNHKEGQVTPDNNNQVEVETKSKNKWFPNPIGLYSTLIITGLYLVFAYFSIWIVEERQISHQKIHITYHPLMSILFGQNSQETSSSMKILQLFLQIIGDFFLNSFLGDTMSIIVRAIICALITSVVHSIIFKCFNHYKYKKILANYPNPKYLSEVDQINMNFQLRQYKLLYYLLSFVIYLIEGVGLAVSGNLVSNSSNNEFIISSIVAFLIDIIILDSIIALIASVIEKRKQQLAYFFQLRGFYDIFASVYIKIKLNDSNI